MPTLQEQIETATAQIETDSDILHDIIHGPASGEGSLITTDAGDVKSVARALAEIGDTSNQALKDLSNVVDGDFATKAASAGVGGSGDMLGSNNLSDLGSVSAARTTLSVYSSAETDAAIASAVSGISGIDQVARDAAAVNAWEIARIDGLGPQGLVNTYLDVFTDQTGIDAGASSNWTHDAAGDFITNLNIEPIICDGGFDDTTFDGAGALNSWTISENNTGDADANAGTVGGETCVSFTTTTPQGNCYCNVNKDIGYWGTESLVSIKVRFDDIANLGTFTDGGAAAYPMVQIYTTHNGGRRSLLVIDGNGRICKNRGGGVNTFHFLTAADTFVDDVWYDVTIWQRMDSNNDISDIKIWIDGELAVNQTGQDYETDSSGSDGYVQIGISAESGTGGTDMYLHSIQCGSFPVTAGDTFFNEDWTSTHYATMTGGGTTGDDGQSFQVSDTRAIVGGGLSIYDGTGIGTTNNVTFAIYGDDGGAPDIAGGALATCTEDVSRDLNSAQAAHWFTFDTPFTPATGTTYWLVVDATTAFRVKHDTAGGYANGQSRTGGTNNAGNDLCFWIQQDRNIGLDMVFVTEAVTAAEDPDEVRALLDIEEVSAATENDDFTASVSRDGGSTWEALTLALVSGTASGRGVYAATGDVSGQPSGDQCVVKLETANGKVIRLHRLAEQADQPLSMS